jgi:acetoin utilization protein AcuB
MKIVDLMTQEVITVRPSQMLSDAVEAMRRKKIRHLPVVESGKLVGIVTDRDVKRALPSVFSGDQDEYDRVLNETPVDKVMTKDPYTVGPKDEIKDALAVMIERKIGAVPVVSNGALIGIVTDIDYLKALLKMLK